MNKLSKHCQKAFNGVVLEFNLESYSKGHRRIKITKPTLTQVFAYDIYGFFKNTCFNKTLPAGASDTYIRNVKGILMLI